jgi:hypothetical protein
LDALSYRLQCIYVLYPSIAGVDCECKMPAEVDCPEAIRYITVMPRQLVIPKIHAGNRPLGRKITPLNKQDDMRSVGSSCLEVNQSQLEVMIYAMFIIDAVVFIEARILAL